MAEKTQIGRAKINATEQSIMKVIKTMADNFDREDEQRYKDIVDTIQQRYNDYDMNPDMFASLVTFDIAEKLNEQAALRFFPQYASNRSIMFVIKHYDFFKRQLSMLVDAGHGTSVCRVDCARWLIKEYIKYSESRNSNKAYTPNMVIDDKCYWKPCFGNGDDWMELCESIELLYWGQVDKFYDIRSRLLQTAGKVSTKQ